MSYRDGDRFVVEREPDSVCELCGTVAETRPYGKNGACVCFSCGMKNPRQTEAMYQQSLYGVDRVEIPKAVFDQMRRKPY